MRQLLFLVSLFSATVATAQTGTITYKRTVALGDIQMEGLPPEIAAMMPKEHSDEKLLYFKPTATLYANNPKPAQQEPNDIEGDGIQIQFNRNVPDEQCYTDLVNKKTIEQKDLMGRQFLISTNMEQRKWKMTGNQKMILDHPAMEATAINEKDTMTAWFTTDISLSAGPEGAGGLPGIILELTINKNLAIKATAIKMDDAVAAKIKQPTKGKKVTEEEYKKLVKQKQDEMEKENGGGPGGTRTMIIMK